MPATKPLVIITGASGNIGGALCAALGEDYCIIGLDRGEAPKADDSFRFDLTEKSSVKLALHKATEQYGKNIAAVIHLAAYFDFTGEKSPLYDAVNVQGTRNLIEALNDYKVERFIYSSTMLVHEPDVPGIKINEQTPLAPGWAYPQSKAETEKVITEVCEGMPYTILRLAGLYNDMNAVPTLAYQIARIYERDFKSHVYAGDLMAGQAFLHQEDMIRLFSLVVECRNSLPRENVIMAGEEEVMGYQALQNRIGQLVFGEREWATFDIPDLVAKPGAWLEEKSEPIVPDAIDQGEKPFIKPFMIDLASDHYDLDISRARELLGWQPKHRIYNGLKRLTDNLKADPSEWYQANGITRPDWMQVASEKGENAEELRDRFEARVSREHRQSLWAHFMNMGLGLWLLMAPAIMGYESGAMTMSDVASGIALVFFAGLSLSRRLQAARWVCVLIGLWVLGAPLVFWAPTAAAYLNDTLVGMLIIGFAVLTRPVPGVSPAAAETGPTTPPGWTIAPSSWFQRMPIIFLAFIGFFISRYLCAYQLGHIDGIWEPFFAGSTGDPQNGTEEIITSSISEAWPVPDAGLGAFTYALEILTGIMGSARRWRTMPWLVMLFGVMIVPLGAISIFFIIIQPVLIGTWCTLCLVAAIAMLVQIPYSLDELVATGQFLQRRVKEHGRPLLRIFFTGDTDDGDREHKDDNFNRSPSVIIADMVQGGVGLPWNLALCFPVGVWLMCTRLSLGASADMANADHIVGSLVLTVAVISLAETGRAFRFLLIPLGVSLFITPFVYGVALPSLVSSLLCGAVLIALSVRRGKIKNSYGAWDRFVI